MKYAGLAGAAVALLVLIACADKEEHPPLVGGCAPGRPCSGNFGIGNLGDPGGGGMMMPGAGGEGSEGELRGTVVDLVDDDFRLTQPYQDPAIVEAERSDGSITSGRWNGVAPFLVTDVAAVQTAWVSVRPESGSTGLRTVHPISTNIGRNVELAIVRADTFDLMYGLLTTSTTRALGAAQVVFGFTGAAAAGAAGVSGVRLTAPEASFIAYKNGATWSAESVATDGSGLAVLGNVFAPAYPGKSLRVRLSGAASGYVDVTVAGDAVTLVEVSLAP